MHSPSLGAVRHMPATLQQTHMIMNSVDCEQFGTRQISAVLSQTHSSRPNLRGCWAAVLCKQAPQSAEKLTNLADSSGAQWLAGRFALGTELDHDVHVMMQPTVRLTGQSSSGRRNP